MVRKTGASLFGTVLALFALFCFSTRILAPEADPGKLVQALGNADFQAREEATRKLLELGLTDPSRILPLLSAQSAQHADAEVRARCDLLREQIVWTHRERVALERVGKDPVREDAVRKLFKTRDIRSVVSLVVACGWGDSLRGIVPVGLLPLPQGEAVPDGQKLEKEKVAEILGIFLENLESFKVGDLDFRGIFLQACRPLMGSAQVPALLTILKENPTESVKWEAGEALASCVDSTRVPELLALLEDPDAKIRAAAARASGGLKSPPIVEALNRLLAQERDRTVQVSAVRALGELACAEGLRAQAAHPESGVRHEVAVWFGRLKRSEDVPLLVQLLQDADENVGYAAIESLGALEDPSAREAAGRRVAGLLDPKDPAVCAMALRALGRLKAKTHAGRIAELAEDPSLPVKIAAIRALGEIGDPAFVQLVADFLYEEEEERGKERASVRATAAGALAAMGDRAAMPPLEALFEDADPEVRGAAFQAFCALASKEDLPRLALLFQEKDLLKSLVAAYAIRRLAGKEKEWSGNCDLDKEVREWLQATLEKKRDGEEPAK